MENFIAVIQELITLFQNLNLVEQKKLEAARKNRVTFVEDCMKDEQAAIMQMRGLDKRREECQESLGWKDYTFQKILDTVSEEERNQLRPLFNDLSFQVKLFRDISGDAKKMIEVNLHQINDALSRQSGNLPYGGDGAFTQKTTHLTSKKV